MQDQNGARLLTCSLQHHPDLDAALRSVLPPSMLVLAMLLLAMFLVASHAGTAKVQFCHWGTACLTLWPSSLT